MPERKTGFTQGWDLLKVYVKVRTSLSVARTFL